MASRFSASSKRLQERQTLTIMSIGCQLSTACLATKTAVTC